MGSRVNLTKKIRFEVFKRDSFKCQYCGKSAPDVVLEVDHIKPVAEGGSNDILNLITSCFECNRGKGKKLLSDTTVLDKKRKELEELNERRIQIDMMMEWQEELLEADNYKVDKLCEYINKIRDVKVTDKGRELLKKYIKKYEFEMVLEAINISFEQYDDKEEAFNKIPKIISNKKKLEKKPYLKDLYYIRAIGKNRFGYINEYKAIQLLEEAYLKNISIDDLRNFTLKCRNWTQFRDGLETYIKNHDDIKSEGDLNTVTITRHDIIKLEEQINNQNKKINEFINDLINSRIIELDYECFNIDDSTREGKLFKYKNYCKIETYKEVIDIINELKIELKIKSEYIESTKENILNATIDILN
ncbi:HNH endonuclease [Clostridium perfringens]|nr:HNH endonuclease [Clostridium perfringens]MDK0408279.1 HNH endonuclease [Clostridium perfringens]MDK0496280.1 HNH endonuclease [Clostridium perfringens]MDK0499188.1 HNH endonuclease [Clostridium perfringens]MDK0920636.1 HNH endonuclease [Clostridium perfringens]